MGTTAIVWTLHGCGRCDRVLRVLEDRARRVTRMDLKRLLSGEEPDVDAMAQFAMAGGEAPIVFIDGRFLDTEEIESLVQ